jgi:integrase
MISIGEVITERVTFKNIQFDNSNDFEWFIEKMSNMNSEVKEINKNENEVEEIKIEEIEVEEIEVEEVEEVVEDEVEVEVEVIEEVKEEVEEDEVEVKPITFEDINETLDNLKNKKNEPLAKKTKDSYKNCFKNFNHKFQLDDYTQLLKEPKPIIEYIYEKFECDSTKKSHLTVLIKLIKTYCHHEENERMICKLMEVLNNNLVTKQSNKMDKGKKDIKKAYSLMAFMKEQKNDIFAHMVLNYGVLRPDELYNMKVLDEDNDVDNYINVDTQTMVINKHKTIANYGVKRIKLDDKFIDMVYEKLGGYVFTNLKNEPYQTGKGLTDMIIREYGCSIYDIRKMKTSIVLKDGDEVEREKVAKFQGHEVGTMVSYYKTYN